jgi:curved DNA binding protein
MASEEQEFDLSMPAVVDKYKSAAGVANEVITKLIPEMVAGKRVVELCTLGDQLIDAGVAGIYNNPKRKVDSKGVAFPTCISVNNCAGHFSPLKDDTTVLKDGDIVKIDLGVQIDGFISQAATTVIVGSGEVATTGRAADVICAAYYGAEVAHRLIRVGGTNSEVTAALAKVAEVFKCSPVEGVLSHQLKRYVIDGSKVILNKADQDHQAEDITFEANEVYSVDIVMSTGTGKTREGDARTTVFKRAPEVTYNLKMKASRTLMAEVSKRFSTMPFTLRATSDEKNARLGITEMVTHNLVDPLPVVYEKDGEIVAHFKFTLLLLPNQQDRLNVFAPPFVSSEFDINSNPDLTAILALETKKTKAKKASPSETPAQ